MPRRCTPRLAVTLAVGLVLFVFFACGCAGATFRRGVYEDEQVRYRVGALAPGFRRIEVEGDDLAFHRAGAGTISANATCTDYDDVPADALLNHLLFETRARKFVVDDEVTLDGRGARHAVVQVELDGVPVELEIYLIKKDGCVFDLVQVRAPEAAPEVRQAFATFVSGFAVLRVGPP